MNRIGFIGSSDIAPLLGISKFKTPHSLYLEKTGESQPNSHSQEKFFMRRKLAEQYILSVFTAITGIQPTQTNRRVQDFEHDFLSCEIDFEFIDPDTCIERNGEIKSIGSFVDMKEWGEEFSNDIPIDYLCQTMFTLGLTGRDQTRVVAMQGFDSFKQYEIFRDDDLIKQIRDAACVFWDRIQTRTPPPPQSVNDFRKLKLSNKSIEADEMIIELLNDFKKAKEASKKEEEIKEQIILLIGDADAVIGGAGKPVLTWKPQDTNRLDVDRLKHELPEIYKEFLKTTTSRVLRVK